MTHSQRHILEQLEGLHKPINMDPWTALYRQFNMDSGTAYRYAEDGESTSHAMKRLTHKRATEAEEKGEFDLTSFLRGNPDFNISDYGD